MTHSLGVRFGLAVFFLVWVPLLAATGWGAYWLWLRAESRPPDALQSLALRGDALKLTEAASGLAEAIDRFLLDRVVEAQTWATSPVVVSAVHKARAAHAKEGLDNLTIQQVEGKFRTRKSLGLAPGARACLQQLALFLELDQGLLQAGLRLLLDGNVATNDDASYRPTGRVLQRSTVDADIAPLWLHLIAHEDFTLFRFLTAHGEHHRILVHRQERFLVETINAVQRGPLMDIVGGFTLAAEPYRAFIEYPAISVLIHGDDALFHAVEDDVHHIESFPQLGDLTLQPAPDLSMLPFPLAQGKSGQQAQAQLPLVARLQHVAERTGRWSRRQGVSLRAVRQTDHGNAEFAPDPFGRFQSVHACPDIDIDQGRIGSHFRRLFNSFDRARRHRAYVVTQTLQAFLQTRSVGTGAPHDQYSRIRHRVLVRFHALHRRQ